MKIVSTFLPSTEIQEQIKSSFPGVDFSFFKGIESIGSALVEAEILLTYGEDLTEEYIQKAKNLKWIMIMSAGMEKMPFKVCEQKGILVTNARGIHKIPMAEFTIGMMLQHMKQIPILRVNEINEEWNRKIPMDELAEKTIVILGIGAIGGEVARLAKAFRMNVIGINRSGYPSEFADTTDSFRNIQKHLSEADFVVSILPSTPETRYFLSSEHFKHMKRSAVFINIGRGDLVKEEILIKALAEGEIAHAYLDVFETEPLPKGHPFWKMKNVTVTPHISSITKKYLPRSFEIFKYNLHTYINKEKDFKNVIDLKRGY